MRWGENKDEPLFCRTPPGSYNEHSRMHDLEVAGQEPGASGARVFPSGNFEAWRWLTEDQRLEEGMNRILVVNDDESTLMLYSEELLEEGYNVTTAHMGPQVTRLIKETRPDLVLLDIRSGQADALDLLMDIRDAYHDLPVLVYADNFPLQFRMKPRSADYWVLKSLSLTDLKLRIRMILERVQSPSGSAHKKGREPGFGYTGMIDSFW